MTRFVETINDQRILNSEIREAENQGYVLTKIFVVSTNRPDERFGDNGAYLIFKPEDMLTENVTNDAEKG